MIYIGHATISVYYNNPSSPMVWKALIQLALPAIRAAGKSVTKVVTEEVYAASKSKYRIL